MGHRHDGKDRQAQVFFNVVHGFDGIVHDEAKDDHAHRQRKAQQHPDDEGLRLLGADGRVGDDGFRKQVGALGGHNLGDIVADDACVLVGHGPGLLRVGGGDGDVEDACIGGVVHLDHALELFIGIVQPEVGADHLLDLPGLEQLRIVGGQVVAQLEVGEVDDGIVGIEYVKLCNRLIGRHSNRKHVHTRQDNAQHGGCDDIFQLIQDLIAKLQKVDFRLLLHLCPRDAERLGLL